LATDGKVLYDLRLRSNIFPGTLNDLSALVGFCTSSPQQGVATLIFWFLFGEPYKYPMNNWHRTAKSFPTWGLDQRYFATFDINPKWERTLPSVANFSWDIYRVPQKNPNIYADIWHPALGLRCWYPPRHLRQIRSAKYLWSKPQVGKDFAVRCQFFMGYLYGSPKRNQNIWKLPHPAVGLRCKNPPRHLSHIKSREIYLT
jgi:hypothetical protein